MRKIKILAVAPYEGMAETISSLSSSREDIDLTVRTGDLKDGLSIAKELCHNNYDVIISRGGTADLIRNELDIPVIDAPLSAYDMLRSIKMAENYSGKFAVAGFQSITNCARMLCDLLKLDVDIYTFESPEMVLPVLKSLKARDYNLVICDMIGSSTAQEIGLNSILIPSGTESIISALDEAVKLVNASRYALKQKEIFQKALFSDEDDYIIFDSNSNLWFSSLSNSPFHTQILHMVKTYLPAFTKTDGQLFERKIDNYILRIRNRHIFYDGRQYTLLKLNKKESLFPDMDKSISIYNKAEEKSGEFTPYHNGANFVGDTHKLISEYSSTSFPVLITGEVGTGKDRAAALIYENGPYQNAPYYVIDCGMLNERKWNTLIDSENSPLSTVHTTIYLKNIGMLSKSQLSKLCTYFEHTGLQKRNRLIFSLTLGEGEDDTIRNYLTNHLSCLLLLLPALRDRLDDISSIATLYINQLNSSLGRQIVGFDNEAMDLIRTFPWPHNLDQFHRIIRELVTITKTSYITAQSVKLILNQEQPSGYMPASSQKLNGLDIHRTLDEINYDIICATLAQKNMNKEMAARQLGISRSTLWRILKSHTESDAD